MRFRHPDGSAVHLAYCTNVHPAESLDGIVGQLAAYAEPARVAAGASLIGVGLWLPAETAGMLAADPAAVARLRRELSTRGLETVTLNGFPYRGFHAPVVKRAVYYPDWSEPARLEYTLNLARVLAGLLPDDAERGSISTLPLAWRTHWTSAQRATAARQLDSLAEGLKQIAADTGRTVRVGIEPEPGCVVETTEQAVQALAGTDPDWIGLCLDACHLAVAHEDPATALAQLRGAGVPVVKLQASTALQVADPADSDVREALGRFAEPRFLHQTREPGPDGALLGSDDLGAALAGALPAEEPWRVHFHVPLHEEPRPPLAGTREVLRATLNALFAGERSLCDHVEVETYTWSVLPGEPVGDVALAAGIADELTWMNDELTALGLSRESS
ncbi:metabolite traffic protein EboE [Streptomyces sp. SID8379]|uniref:metabolite traffic protein EboE n=1 Tax=unclassified Streptomyces TaxID=2593676 RepID=UPI00036CCDDE|nr:MULTISPECIES: metabolite traffic protein EboE [unclassified Streptomyces]MYW67597.1 metabolite traffic protein EboE [Streptomyces sp. SID8379]